MDPNEPNKKGAQEEQDSELSDSVEKKLVHRDGKTIIGPFVFSGGVSRHMKVHLWSLYHNIVNSKKTITTLRLDNGRFHQIMPSQALDAAESYTIEVLSEFSLVNNKLNTTTFLRKCQFPNLLHLNLARNHLTSLASLFNDLHFPQLEELILPSNQFTSLRGLRKWRLPRLQRLQLEINFILQLRDIELAYLPSLSELTLYANNIADLRLLFKCNFPRLSQLDIYENSFEGDICLTYPLLATKFTYLSVRSLNH